MRLLVDRGVVTSYQHDEATRTRGGSGGPLPTKRDSQIYSGMHPIFYDTKERHGIVRVSSIINDLRYIQVHCRHNHMYMMPPIGPDRTFSHKTPPIRLIKPKTKQAPEYAKKPFRARAERKNKRCGRHLSLPIVVIAHCLIIISQMHPASLDRHNHPAQRPRPYPTRTMNNSNKNQHRLSQIHEQFVSTCLP